jgi:hypothetical protein
VDYIPSVEDILRSGMRICGINETSLFMKNYLRENISSSSTATITTTTNTNTTNTPELRLWEVGSPRGERKKWLHILDDMDLAILTADISLYDARLMEDTSENILGETLVLFESYMNSRTFRATDFLLFLRQGPGLADQLLESPFEQAFPDILPMRDARDVNTVTEYVIERFTALNKDDSRRIYIHIIKDIPGPEDVKIIEAIYKEIYQKKCQK